RRGWLDSLRTLPAPPALLAALARSPEARLLRRLEVVYDMAYHPFDFDEWLEGPNEALRGDEKAAEMYDAPDVLPSLVESPYLGNLRVFKFGFSDLGEQLGHSTMVRPFGSPTAGQVIALLERAPRLEELYLNTTINDVEQLF